MTIMMTMDECNFSPQFKCTNKDLLLIVIFQRFLYTVKLQSEQIFFAHDNTTCSLQSHAGAVLPNRAALPEERLTPFLFIAESTWLVLVCVEEC